MTNPVKTIKSRLFRVADEFNADGCYDLRPFDDEQFNADIDGNFYDNGDGIEAINDLLHKLLAVLFGKGGGECFFIDINDPDRHYDNRYVFDNGTVRLHSTKDDSVTVIPNIIDEIDADSETSVFFVLVSEDRAEHVWIVSKQQEVA